MKIGFSVLLLVLVALQSRAQSGAGGGTKQLISASLMALTSSTKQGGEGPSGSTLLSQSEYMYCWPAFGLGLFYMYDQQGTNEKDTTYGLKAEAYLEPFYLELGYAVAAQRAYTDRTIADQTGDGTVIGAGVRFKLGAAAGPGGGWFFQASYKMRTLAIKKQDGVSLDESITQTDGYPLVGLGYQF